MRQLFPSSSSLPKRPRLSEAFDPTHPCVALQQKNKKKAARAKPSKISVIVVQDASKGIPKGQYRKNLQQSKCIDKVELTRSMSASQVKNAIITLFSHLPLKAFTYLVLTDKSTLSINPDQEQDGDKIITTFHSTRGTLYLLRRNQDISTKGTATTLLASAASTQGTSNVSFIFKCMSSNFIFLMVSNVMTMMMCTCLQQTVCGTQKDPEWLGYLLARHLNYIFTL